MWNCLFLEDHSPSFSNCSVHLLYRFYTHYGSFISCLFVAIPEEACNWWGALRVSVLDALRTEQRLETDGTNIRLVKICDPRFIQMVFEDICPRNHFPARRWNSVAHFYRTWYHERTTARSRHQFCATGHSKLFWRRQTVSPHFAIVSMAIMYDIHVYIWLTSVIT